jgi:hypothetical protein
VHTIVADIGAHSAVGIGEHRAVVHEREAAAEREATQPVVPLANLRTWIEIAAPEQLSGRRYGGNDDGDVVGAGEVDHRQYVVLVIIECRRTGIASDVVGASHDVHDARSQRHDVLPEPRQHLRRRLAANAATDDAVGEEHGISSYPVVGDRVAHEHGARSRSTSERRVRRLVATQVRPVGGLLRAVAFRVPRQDSGLESGELGPEGLRRCRRVHE